MVTADVDLDAGTWIIRARKRAPSHLVYLSPPAIALLSRRKRDGDFVFPSPTRRGRPMREHALVWSIVNARADCPLVHWTAHDLRRSAATLLGEMDYSTRPDRANPRSVQHQKAGRHLQSVDPRCRGQASMDKAWRASVAIRSAAPGRSTSSGGVMKPIDNDDQLELMRLRYWADRSIAVKAIRKADKGHGRRRCAGGGDPTGRA